MTYEYNAESQRMDFPNPFYVENWFLLATTVILLVGGIGLLVVSRGVLSGGHGWQSLLPLLPGIGLLVLGLFRGKRLLTQLRVFFGRGVPAGLAPELTGEATGRSAEADAIKETLRQNAITYPEPTGPLNGLLYAWIRELIFAPRPVQVIAQRQFQTGIAVVVTLLSFLVAWIGFSDRQAAAWMGLFYFVFSVVLLLRPLEAGGAAARADVGMRGLIVLVLVAIFGPVVMPLLSHHLPGIAWLSLETQTLFLLLASLASVGMYFRALMNQMGGPPNTNMAREQVSLSMNCHPKQLMDELDRTLQDAWVERIPNRRYARLLPEVGNGAGTFSAELVEETQPLPPNDQRRIDVATAFRLSRFRWIALLDVTSVLLTGIATLLLVMFGLKLVPAGAEPRLFSLLTLGLALLALGSYCLDAGRVLWQRFDFTSRIVWVEMQGNYQSARMDVGNTISDRVKTEKQIINIETMTLRVWAAEFDSVIFGKGATRFITGLRGVPAQARELVDHLTAFAHDQSVVVAPTSQTDLKKSAVLSAMGVAGGPSAAAASLLGAVNRGTAHRPADLVCPACAAPVDAGARFCAHCGAALTQA